MQSYKSTTVQGESILNHFHHKQPPSPLGFLSKPVWGQSTVMESPPHLQLDWTPFNNLQEKRKNKTAERHDITGNSHTSSNVCSSTYI